MLAQDTKPKRFSLLKAERKMARTEEERKAADRERHRKTYEKKKEQIREKNLARYYKKKEADPDYHKKPKGRPPKVAPVAPVAPVEEAVPAPVLIPVAPVV